MRTIQTAPVARALHDHVADPKAQEKREKAERRISAAHVLDGSMAASAEAMRRRLSF